jgi:glycosyltransferase involved in cell wall biosynthesis
LSIRITQRAEDRCCRDADLVVSILPRAIDHLQTRGLDPKRYVVVPNGVNLDEDARPSSDCVPNHATAILADLRRDDRFVIGYAGSHTTSYGLDTLIEAVRLGNDLRPGVVFVGDGPERSRLQSMAADLPGVRFLDRMPRHAATSTLQACDAIFVRLRAAPLFRFGIGMNKIFDAMLVERPVVAAYTAGNDPIGEAGRGITVPAGDTVALADAIRRVHATPPAERNGLGTAGSAFVRAHHDYRVLASRFLKSILTAEVRR